MNKLYVNTFFDEVGTYVTIYYDLFKLSFKRIVFFYKSDKILTQL